MFPFGARGGWLAVWTLWFRYYIVADFLEESARADDGGSVPYPIYRHRYTYTIVLV